MRVAAVQLQVGTDKAENVARALRLIDEAAARGAQLIVLPEYMTYMGPARGYAAIAETVPGETSLLVAARARELGVVIHGGSLIERCEPAGPGPRFANTSYVADARGEVGAVYRKVHLFDVAVQDDVRVRESEALQAGEELVAAEVGDVKLGLSICYDLRFPELYRALALDGATVMVVPAAFAEATGRAHWEVLLRARAIENGAYVIAAAQCGETAAYPTYGHSMIVDPWGVVLAELPTGDGVVTADIEPGAAAQRRAQVPVLANRRPAVYNCPVTTASLAFSPDL